MSEDVDIRKQVYKEKNIEYQAKIDSILTYEKEIRQDILKNTNAQSLNRVILASEILDIVSLFIAKHYVHIATLRTKNEYALNEARKTIYKAIIYLEEAVSNYVDAPYSEYADKVDQLESLSEPMRYYIVRKLGLALRMLEDAYGDNTKWRWTFVELEARFATVAKNIMDLKKASKEGLDPHSEDYDTTVFHLRLVKKLLEQAANRYREKYELSTGRIDDFRLAINYLRALHRIHLILNERQDAEEVKRKAEIWKNKMEQDQKKSEEKKR